MTYNVSSKTFNPTIPYHTIKALYKILLPSLFTFKIASVFLAVNGVGFCGLDIAFVVDTSGSIRSNQPRGVDNLQLIKSFLTDIVRSPSLSIARHLDRIALVTFEATAQIIFDLHTRTRLDQVLIGIKLIPEPYGETNTPDAINIARQVDFNYICRYLIVNFPFRRCHHNITFIELRQQKGRLIQY